MKKKKKKISKKLYHFRIRIYSMRAIHEGDAYIYTHYKHMLCVCAREREKVNLLLTRNLLRAHIMQLLLSSRKLRAKNTLIVSNSMQQLR